MQQLLLQLPATKLVPVLSEENSNLDQEHSPNKDILNCIASVFFVCRCIEIKFSLTLMHT